jgi:hypothetical protein
LREREPGLVTALAPVPVPVLASVQEQARVLRLMARIRLFRCCR